jgi:hypothetical protein
MDTSKALPLDLAAVQADDELLASLGSGQLSVDDAVSRALAAWRHDVEVEPLPALLDVDTALVLVGAGRRSLVSRALRWLRRLVSDNPE